MTYLECLLRCATTHELQEASNKPSGRVQPTDLRAWGCCGELLQPLQMILPRPLSGYTAVLLAAERNGRLDASLREAHGGQTQLKRIETYFEETPSL